MPTPRGRRPPLLTSEVPAGRQLLLTNALETEELDPPKQWVPWVTVNGRVSPADTPVGLSTYSIYTWLGIDRWMDG